MQNSAAIPSNSHDTLEKHRTRPFLQPTYLEAKVVVVEISVIYNGRVEKLEEEWSC